MKKFLKNLFLVMLTVATVTVSNIHVASASVPPSFAVRLLYSTANLTGAAHVILVTTTARAIQGLLVSNESVDPVYLAVGSSHGVYESESDVALLPSSGTVFFPMSISGDQRISVRSSGRTAVNGHLEMTGLYY